MTNDTQRGWQKRTGSRRSTELMPLAALFLVGCSGDRQQAAPRTPAARYVCAKECRAWLTTNYENYLGVAMARGFATVQHASKIEDFDRKYGFVHSAS